VSTTVTSGIDSWLQDEAAADSRQLASSPSPCGVNPPKPDVNVYLGYDPFPKQQDFHASPAKYRLFGGAAGPGKSKALLMETVLQALKYPAANTLLLRRTFPELEASLLLYFRRDVPRELYKSFNESKHVVTWWNDSTTRFGYCARENDVYQYQGAEFVFIGIDELTLFTLRQWQFLTSRNRCPIPGAFPCMAAATNPGNIGHAWVKSLWIDKQPASGMESAEQYDPADYDFIAAKVYDNPIYANDAGYIKTLNALPSHLRRAFLEGDWDVFAGQYFDRFDPSSQVFRAEAIDWKPWWQRWISIDWGYEHPSAVYWHAAPGRATNIFREAAPRSADLQPASLNLPSPLRPNEETQPGQSVEAQASATQAASKPGAASQPFVANVSSQASGRHLGSSAAPPGADPLGLAPAVPFASSASSASGAPEENRGRVITYREYVTHRTAPRELARQIIDRGLQSAAASPSSALSSRQRADVWPDEGSASALRGETQSRTTRIAGHESPNLPIETVNENRRLEADATPPREKIDAIYLSPDAFARRTDEASIAEQMGDVFVAAGLPRPIPADDDRVGGWMLMYQMLDAGEWLLTDNCIELIRTLPNLVRDPARIEDVEKMDGDDPADAARYGLKTRYGSHSTRGGHVHLPLEQRIAERLTSADPTLRAIQIHKARIEESRRNKPMSFLRRRR
jgi:hypothetical protein